MSGFLKCILFAFFSIITVALYAQSKFERLVIEKGETYDFGNSDILVADTLIMKDSSTIVLNKLKSENFIHTKYAIIGIGCSIDGVGIDGGVGRDGRQGFSPAGPCKDGTDGTQGTSGLDGRNATHLYLYLNQITIEGKLFLKVIGGKGGNGGNGGNGGSGGPGTLHCNGGDGGNGGNGGNGGKGGNGGAVTVNCKNCPVTYEWIGEKIVIYNYGGREGAGGKPGAAGYFGGGPSGRNGTYGQMGKAGLRGDPGLKGSVNFVIE